MATSYAYLLGMISESDHCHPTPKLKRVPQVAPLFGLAAPPLPRQLDEARIMCMHQPEAQVCGQEAYRVLPQLDLPSTPQCSEGLPIGFQRLLSICALLSSNAHVLPPNNSINNNSPKFSSQPFALSVGDPICPSADDPAVHRISKADLNGSLALVYSGIESRFLIHSDV